MGAGDTAQGMKAVRDLYFNEAQRRGTLPAGAKGANQFSMKALEEMATRAGGGDPGGAAVVNTGFAPQTGEMVKPTAQAPQFNEGARDVPVAQAYSQGMGSLGKPLEAAANDWLQKKFRSQITPNETPVGWGPQQPLVVNTGEGQRDLVKTAYAMSGEIAPAPPESERLLSMGVIGWPKGPRGLQNLGFNTNLPPLVDSPIQVANYSGVF